VARFASLIPGLLARCWTNLWLGRSARRSTIATATTIVDDSKASAEGRVSDIVSGLVGPLTPPLSLDTEIHNVREHIMELEDEVNRCRSELGPYRPRHVAPEEAKSYKENRRAIQDRRHAAEVKLAARRQDLANYLGLQRAAQARANRGAVSAVARVEAVVARNPPPQPRDDFAEEQLRLQQEAMSGVEILPPPPRGTKLLVQSAPSLPVDVCSHDVTRGEDLQRVEVCGYVVVRAVYERILGSLRTAVGQRPPTPQHSLQLLARQYSQNTLEQAKLKPPSGWNYDSYADLGPNHIIIYAITALFGAFEEEVVTARADQPRKRPTPERLVGVATALAAAVALGLASTTAVSATFGLALIAIFGVSDLKAIVARFHANFVDCDLGAVCAEGEHLWNNFDLIKQTTETQQLTALLPHYFRQSPASLGFPQHMQHLSPIDFHSLGTAPSLELKGDETNSLCMSSVPSCRGQDTICQLETEQPCCAPCARECSCVDEPSPCPRETTTLRSITSCSSSSSSSLGLSIWGPGLLTSGSPDLQLLNAQPSFRPETEWTGG